MEKVKNRLKEIRINKNLTQKKVETDTGINRTMLSRYENQVVVPCTQNLVDLAFYYNVGLDYILCLTDKP